VQRGEPSERLHLIGAVVAISIPITNVDDHLRNHGFLHVERGRWRLSPAFDINLFPEGMRELKTWMPVSSHCRSITRRYPLAE